MNECQVQIVNIHSEFITDVNVTEKLSGLDGLLVAPGFGHRGVEGKIVAVKYARENGLPFFGICLGMQMAVIEFARNVLGLKNAHSTEMDPHTTEPVIDLMEEQNAVTIKGGTMRLGSYPCTIKENSLAETIYGTRSINERHRHRWEFNNKYLEQFENAGMVASGKTQAPTLLKSLNCQNTHFYRRSVSPRTEKHCRKPSTYICSFYKSCKSLRRKEGGNKESSVTKRNELICK